MTSSKASIPRKSFWERLIDIGPTGVRRSFGCFDILADVFNHSEIQFLNQVGIFQDADEEGGR